MFPSRSLLILLLLCSALVPRAQIITTVAGNGTMTNTGDGGPAISAGINYPADGIFDKFSNYYIATGLSSPKIRVVHSTGVITTIAGTGISGYYGDGGVATAAKFRNPQALALDTAGNIYVADAEDNRVRKINIVTNIITTITGNGVGAFSGDGGPASAAQISHPLDICFDNLGNLYIADYGNLRVRKIDTLGIITTVAGTGIPIYGGDGGFADTTRIQPPTGLCVDETNNLYIADYYSRVLKINDLGIISTVVGGAISGSGPDGVPATATTTIPWKIGMDKAGNLFISEYNVDKVRRVNTSGIISTIAGTGVPGYFGDGGAATAAQVNHPAGLALDSCGNLYISDVRTYRVRKVAFHPGCAVDSVSLSSQSVSPQTISVHPNPVTDLLTIQCPTQHSYRLFTATGALVQSGTLPQGASQHSLAALPPGLYLLQLIAAPTLPTAHAGERTIIKIIKQ